MSLGADVHNANQVSPLAVGLIHMVRAEGWSVSSTVRVHSLVSCSAGSASLRMMAN